MSVPPTVPTGRHVLSLDFFEVLTGLQFGSRVGCGLRAGGWGSGFGVWGLGFVFFFFRVGVWGLGFGVWDLWAKNTQPPWFLSVGAGYLRGLTLAVECLCRYVELRNQVQALRRHPPYRVCLHIVETTQRYSQLGQGRAMQILHIAGYLGHEKPPHP